MPPLQPRLVWEEGNKEFGCSYHKLCRFNHDQGRIQVDIFVMKAIAHRRPIAVTISSHNKEGSEVKREKLGFNTVEEAKGGTSTIERALISVRLVPEPKAEPLARSMTDFITEQQDEIRRALEKVRE